MNEWSLSRLLDDVHDDIQQRLEVVRKSFGHPGAKGDASEGVWLELLQKYLPQRYRAESGFVVDSNGDFSDQIDIMIFDRQYSPFIFSYQGKIIVPAESIYAIFEAKQSISLHQVRYAKEKISSVRKLYRTSLPIPHAGGVYPPKQPIHILGGMLAFGSDWNPAMGDNFLSALNEAGSAGIIDIGCVAAHGHFNKEPGSDAYVVEEDGKPATAFLFKLISMLQFSGTVPMIDVLAYSKWLAK
jgi:hypothetical protein